ncbi:hypothetical protein D3H59_26955, partial [Micromonospora endophytica]
MTVDVTVIAALLLLCIIALMVGWMVVASAFGGMLLWTVQWRCVSSEAFQPIRRHGLRRGGWELLLSAAGPGVLRRLVARESWRRVLLLLLVPLVGFMVPVSLPYVVVLLVPESVASGEFGQAIERVCLFTGSLGALVAIRVFCKGLQYIAQPDKPRGKIPALRFPDSLSSQGRHRLATNAFWYRAVDTGELLAGTYPVLVLFAVLADLKTFTAQPSEADTSLPPLLGIIVVVLALTPLFIPAHIAASRLRRRLAGWQLSVEICQVLAPPREQEEDDPLELPETLSTLADAHRSQLVEIAVLLNQTAMLWDRRQSPGFAPHPAATVLRAVGTSIRRHLQSPQSCDPALPGDVRETLRMVLDLLVEPNRPSLLRELASRVQAFDEDGRPAVETFVKPPGRLAVAMTRLTDSTQRTAAVLAAMTGMA